jgi:hypothetical protein
MFENRKTPRTEKIKYTSTNKEKTLSIAGIA